MIELSDLFSVYYLALALTGVLALLWIILEASEKKPSRPQFSSRIFACGMKASPNELNIHSMNYYDYMKRFFRTELLARAHSGNLSHYITWILVGMAFIMAVLLILW